MANIWDEFDKAIDTEGLAKDVADAAETGDGVMFRMIPMKLLFRSWS